MSIINPNFNPIKEFDPTWITKEIDLSGINYLENLGSYLCKSQDYKDNVTVSQIRNIFGEVKRIEANVNDSPELNQWKQDFLFLRPKIAYAAARVLSDRKNSRIKGLKSVLEKAHDAVETTEDMKRFAKFFEAIVAYHKVYESKY